MAELEVKKTRGVRSSRHRDRMSQIPIYLGKQFRFFINQSDWKVLPMAAIIAALVAMVIRNRLFLTMEGTLIGAFALCCVAIWNGCFNSIQAVCRERPIIKREHRSGMHISSYVLAHMIYQLLLCLAQTGVSMYVLLLMGVQFPAEGFLTPWMIVDVGISMLLISYASDMMSLFISSLCHTTTGAMTVMPFVLIFQLVFSGGIIPLPERVKPLSNFTISTYGIAAIASQSGYNELPMMTAWNTVNNMRNNEVGGDITLGQIMDMLKSPALESRRDMQVLKSFTLGEITAILNDAEPTLHLRDKVVAIPVTMGSVLNTLLSGPNDGGILDREVVPAAEGTPALTLRDMLQNLMNDRESQELLSQEIGETLTLGQVMDALKVDEALEGFKDEIVNAPVTLGQIVDFLESNPSIQAQRDRIFTVKTTINELLNVVGEEQVKNAILTKTAQASSNDQYERTLPNVTANWVMLGFFILFFAIASTISLELIDKDKR